MVVHRAFGEFSSAGDGVHTGVAVPVGIEMGAATAMIASRIRTARAWARFAAVGTADRGRGFAAVSSVMCADSMGLVIVMLLRSCGR